MDPFSLLFRYNRRVRMEVLGSGKLRGVGEEGKGVNG